MNLAKNATELRSKRLLLRGIAMSDSGAFLDIFSDAHALRYWSKEPIQSQEEAQALIQQELEWLAAGSCVSWGLALTDSDLLIGKVSLFQFNEQNRRAEIGYILDRSQWGNGYMSEALECVLAYAFDELQLHRIEADTDPENLPSLALLEKFGFQREGRFRDRWFVHGEWHDSVMLGLLARDYRP